MSARIKLENINKVYDDGLHAIVDFNLEIEDKEFVALVGPSGCGKSTTLRMIAGLENISNGNFIVDNQVMNQMPSKDRDIAMVFQSYALYPHLSVYENMAFGLKLRRMKRSIIDEKVNDAAKILGLENTLNRKPRELSGGQRQRVALGRAIVRKPKIFLMDEPLSNLDAKLRGEMRIALRDIHEKLGTMTIYVTHDQIEAMTMADKIVIINEGFVQQIGKPIELFNDPANLFVAKFIGTPEMNLISGKIENKRFVSKFVSFEIPADKYDFVKTHEGKDIVLGIRPVDIHL